MQEKIYANKNSTWQKYEKPVERNAQLYKFIRGNKLQMTNIKILSWNDTSLLINPGPLSNKEWYIYINTNLLTLTCVAPTSFHKVEIINSFVSGLIKRQRMKCWSGNRQRNLHWLRGRHQYLWHSTSADHSPLLYMQQEWNTTIVCTEFKKKMYKYLSHGT